MNIKFFVCLFLYYKFDLMVYRKYLVNIIVSEQVYYSEVIDNLQIKCKYMVDIKDKYKVKDLVFEIFLLYLE